MVSVGGHSYADRCSIGHGIRDNIEYERRIREDVCALLECYSVDLV